jgi:3-oxoacyl-[acyl-carrier protein] reductase
MKKKNIIIFGANSGLGKEILYKLLKMNANFYLSAKSLKAKSNLLYELNSTQKKKIKFFEVYDFSSNENYENFFKKLKKVTKQIHIAFNCVGYFGYDSMKKLNIDQLLLTFQLNVFSSIIISSNLVHFNKKKELLKIFHIGSSSGYEGFKNTVYYCSAKHALVGAVKSMNKETVKNNIINYLISMGGMKTKMGKKIKNQSFKNCLDPKKVADLIINLAFLKINGYTEEVIIKSILK